MEHRGINYGIEELGPGKWQWTIYPKIEEGTRVRGEASGTREEAEIACKKAIDENLG